MKRYLLALMAMVALNMGAVTKDVAQEAVTKFGTDTAWTHGSFSVAVYDISGDSLVAGHNEDLSCITASTMKTVTSATALQLMGPNYKFKTCVYLHGEQKGKKFKGNIHVVGSGDPTLGSVFFPRHANLVDEVLQALKARGIEKVEGDITFNESVIPFPAANGWWEVGDLAWNYGMGIHGFNFYDNRSQLRFTAKDGQVSNVTFSPAVPGVTVINRLGSKVADDVDLRLEEGTNSLMLIGTAANRDYDMCVAIPQPSALFADSLLRVMAKNDIKYKHKPEALQKAKDATQTLLVEHESAPLADIITSLLDRSDNMMTEGVLRVVALHEGREGTAVEGAAVVDSVWRARGLDTRCLFQHDGSGLARANKNSARFFAQMLSYMAKHPSEGVSLSQLMPVVGKRIGKLIPETSLANNMVVKSGSMTQVQCFVGYYPAAKPQYAWAILSNNWNCTRGELRDKMDEMLIAIFGK